MASIANANRWSEGVLCCSMAETKQLVHIADLREYVASNPADKDAAAFAKLSGVRTVLIVPMLKDGEAMGAIVIYRQEVRPSTTGKSSFSRASRPKPSSPSRTRGCLTNCASEQVNLLRAWNGRQLRRTCCRSLARRSAI